jgi:arsenate reductase
MSQITIYHNPDCGTSRNVLGLIRNSGEEPTIIEYLKTPPDRETLKTLIAAMGVPVRAVLREKGTPYAELGLDDSKWSDEHLIDFMLQHPILINRPIVVSPLGALLCRPSEAVLDILPQPQRGAFSKEDGEAVVNAKAAVSESRIDLPNIDTALFQQPDAQRLMAPERATHAPRFLLLYGSLRERSFSRLAAEEAARILRARRRDTDVQPSGLPWWMTRLTITQRSGNCTNWCNGPKAWCGVRPSATAP